jgi:hypothetical protein
MKLRCKYYLAIRRYLEFRGQAIREEFIASLVQPTERSVALHRKYSSAHVFRGSRLSLLSGISFWSGRLSQVLSNLSCFSFLALLKVVGLE